MANETIYGCVETDGSITFPQATSDPERTCYHNGCIIWTGEHAGQVAVTIDNGRCDDTYYGCVDWTTGKFQVSVPSNWCALCSLGYTTVDDIHGCFNGPGGKLPKMVQITFSGVRYCCDGELIPEFDDVPYCFYHNIGIMYLRDAIPVPSAMEHCGMSYYSTNFRYSADFSLGSLVHITGGSARSIFWAFHQASACSFFTNEQVSDPYCAEDGFDIWGYGGSATVVDPNE